MKSEAGRTQDLAYAARMLGAASGAGCRETREIVRRWLPEADPFLALDVICGELL